MQVSAIVLAIERIVALYKQSLDIRKVKQDLSKQDLGPEIEKLIETKVEEKLRIGLKGISTEIREKFGKLDDENRANELEIQIKIELLHMAKRINQGAAYEARAGLPLRPPPLTDDQRTNPELADKHTNQMAIYELRLRNVSELNTADAAVSHMKEIIDADATLFLDYDKEANQPEGENRPAG